MRKLSENISTTLVEVIGLSERFIGNNIKVISASLGILNDSLVYKIRILDGNDTFNRLK
jgi:hypothetical protein